MKKKQQFTNGLIGIYELTPILDSRQSFYHKALVFEYKNGVKVLHSYETPVAVVYKTKSSYRLVNGVEERFLFSNTTLRHIKEFLYQELGIEKLKKKDLKATL